VRDKTERSAEVNTKANDISCYLPVRDKTEHWGAGSVKVDYAA
jgi:hypothetical protein